MGQFKPMVKMETTEPSVELKLKKGGHVSMKKKEEHGHKMMDGGMTGPMMARGMPPAMMAMAPKRPPMAMRRKAMTAMPTAMPTPMMKKGGEMESSKVHKEEMAEMGKVEKELKHHESMKASKAHKGLKSGGQASGDTTMVHTSKKDSAHGTGSVKEGNGGGYKKGGSINSETSSGDYVNTKVDQAKPDNASGTGGVRMSNAGGFKKGGKAKYNTGGGVDKYAVDNVVGTPKGVTNTTTGAVKESNGGGYKKGGASKKHFAMGGSVNNTGSAVAMPQGNKPASKPVHINQLSGTFKKGGKVKKYQSGGAPTEDLSKGAFDNTLNGKYNEDMDMAKYLRNIPSNIYQGAKKLMGSLSNSEMAKVNQATGSVTKSKESVTVSPPQKKRGGSIKC
jgi:hypothetical protein